MPSGKVALIGGTGFSILKDLIDVHAEEVETPFGLPSAPLVHGTLSGHQLVFLARHGEHHIIPPHRINYRANLWSLRESGVKYVIAIAAVGGINPRIEPKCIVFPNQLIDYTWSREHTFFSEDLSHVTHIDFTNPYCEALRALLIKAARNLELRTFGSGTYGATQGPRLETAAEIEKLARDGCDIVGMTGMPEASLAKELGLCYATCAICANPAPGRGAGEVSMDDIRANLAEGMEAINRLLREVLSLI